MNGRLDVLIELFSNICISSKKKKMVEPEKKEKRADMVILSANIHRLGLAKMQNSGPPSVGIYRLTKLSSYGREFPT